jgi:PhnB protein
MTAIEINMIVADSVAAVALYERVFGANNVKITNQGKGLSEALFTLYGIPFHLLDENPTYGMIAPKDSDNKPFGVNITVPDIAAVHKMAMESGFTEVQPITEMTGTGLVNCILIDPYGFPWVVHQVVESKSKFKKTHNKKSAF